MRNIFTLIILLVSSPAAADVVQDQVAPGFSNSAPLLQIGGATEQRIAQTFEAGISGILDHVSLVLSCDIDSVGDLTVEIQEVDGAGAPNGSVLGSNSVASSTLHLEPIFFQDIGITGVTLNAGVQYAIVISADPQAECTTITGPCSSCFFTYERGHGYVNALPAAKDDWTVFDPTGDDIPFMTWMYIPEPREPLYCKFVDAMGMPNDWLPNHVPICACISDSVGRSNRCWFALPDFVLWREIPLPWEAAKGKANWSVVPMSAGFEGLSVFESAPDSNFEEEEVEFAAGLKAGEATSTKARYTGTTDQTIVDLFFEGPDGPINVRFETFMNDPDEQ